MIRSTDPDVLPLTGLRALAAWWVALYHFSEVAPVDGRMLAFTEQGLYAVDLFFVLSGFVLAMRYGAMFAPGVRRAPFAWFIGVRLARVYPLHLVMLLAFVSIPLTLAVTGRTPDTERFPIDYFIQSLFLVQNWGLAQQFAWNVPAWSISAELLFYLVFPFLAWAVARCLRWRHGLLLLGIAAFGAILAMGLAFGGLVYSTARFGALRCLTECLLGVWVFHLSLRIPPRPASGLAMVAVAAALFGLYGIGLAPNYIALPAGFACLVWGLVEPRHAASRLLSHPVLVWLGQVSFSTYMIHYFARDWIKFLLVDRVSDNTVFIVYILVVAAASALLHHWVETPGRRIGRRIADTWFPLAKA